MTVFRLCREKHERDLSGNGARIAGGRWNSKGTPLIYTSQSRALCTVEVAVHIPIGILPPDYRMLEMEIPDQEQMLVIDEKDLPHGWREHPPSNSTQLIGDEFVRANSGLILKVPSAVVEGDFNYLLNPLHPGMESVRITDSRPFRFDERLVGRTRGAGEQ